MRYFESMKPVSAPLLFINTKQYRNGQGLLRIVQLPNVSGTVSTEMGDRVRVQFPVPGIYFGM